MITYQNIEVKIGDNKLKNLCELRIKNKINDHAKVYFTGIVLDEEKDRYIELVGSDTMLEINQVDESLSSCLFRGIITNIEIQKRVECRL